MPRPSITQGRLAKIGCRGGLFVALVLLSQWLEEWYPLSHFPMYSGFSSSQWYVYLVDEHGEPIAAERDYATRTAYLKKVYVRNLSKHRKNPDKAVQETLEFVAARKRERVTAQSLTLMSGQIKRKQDHVQVQTRELGSLDP